MTDVVTVVATEHLIETEQAVDTLVVKELELLGQTETELQELLVAELELIETQSTLSEVLDVLGEQVVLEIATQGPVGPAGAEGPPGPQGPVGPAGPAGNAPPTDPTFGYSGGKLVSVTYGDGSSKALSYTGDVLTRVDSLRVGSPGVRKDLTYNPDGTLAAVTQSAI